MKEDIVSLSYHIPLNPIPPSRAVQFHQHKKKTNTIWKFHQINIRISDKNVIDPPMGIS